MEEISTYKRLMQEMTSEQRTEFFKQMRLEYLAELKCAIKDINKQLKHMKLLINALEKEENVEL